MPADSKIVLRALASKMAQSFCYDAAGAMQWLKVANPELVSVFDDQLRGYVAYVRKTQSPASFALLIFFMGTPEIGWFAMELAHSPIKVVMANITRLGKLVKGNPTVADAVLDLVVHQPEVALELPHFAYIRLLEAAPAAALRALKWLQALPDEWADEAPYKPRQYLDNQVRALLKE